MNERNCLTCVFYIREGICKGECGQTGLRVINPQFTCGIGFYENEY